MFGVAPVAARVGRLVRLAETGRARQAATHTAGSPAVLARRIIQVAEWRGTRVIALVNVVGHGDHAGARQAVAASSMARMPWAPSSCASSGSCTV